MKQVLSKHRGWLGGLGLPYAECRLDPGAAGWRHCLAVAPAVLKLKAGMERSRAVAPGNSQLLEGVVA